MIENGGQPYEAYIPEPRAMRRSFQDNYEKEQQKTRKKFSLELPEDLQAAIGLATCG